MTQLLDLPAQLLLNIFTCLSPEDLYSRCAAAQSCTTLLDITSSPSLWPQQQQQQPQAEGLIFKRILLVLSRLLHLPPQAFVVQDDSKRSAKFCITAPMYSLRGLLGVSDVEDLAASTARSVQDKINKFPSWLITHPPPLTVPSDAGLEGNSHTEGAAAAAAAATGRVKEPAGSQAAAAAVAAPAPADAPDAQQLAPPVLPPHAVMQVCRSDRGTLRLSLNPAAVVKTVLEDQLLGLPLLHLGHWASPAHLSSPSLLPPAHDTTLPETPFLSLGQLFAYDTAVMSHVPVAELLPQGGEVVALPIGTASSQPGQTGALLPGQAASGGEVVFEWSRLRRQLLRRSLRRTRALLSKRRQGPGAGQGAEQQVAALLRSRSEQAPQGTQQEHSMAAPLTSAPPPASPVPGDQTLEEVWASIHLALLSSIPRHESKARGQGQEQHEDEAARQLYDEAEAEVFSSVALRLMALMDAVGGGREPPPVQPSLASTSGRSQVAAAPVALAAGGVRMQAGPAARLHGPAAAAAPGAAGGARVSLERACRLSMQLQQLSRLWRDIQGYVAAYSAGAESSDPAAPPRPPVRHGSSYACMGLHELQAAVRQAGGADAQACLRCVSRFTEALALGAAGGGGPGPLLGLLEAACGAAAEYSLPVQEQSALGLGLGGGGEGEYREQLGRAVAAAAAGAGAGREGELGCGEGSLARMAMLRSCTQVAYWAAWCLGLL